MCYHGNYCSINAVHRIVETVGLNTLSLFHLLAYCTHTDSEFVSTHRKNFFKIVPAFCELPVNSNHTNVAMTATCTAKAVKYNYFFHNKLLIYKPS